MTEEQKLKQEWEEVKMLYRFVATLWLLRFWAMVGRIKRALRVWEDR